MVGRARRRVGARRAGHGEGEQGGEDGSEDEDRDHHEGGEWSQSGDGWQAAATEADMAAWNELVADHPRAGEEVTEAEWLALLSSVAQ